MEDDRYKMENSEEMKHFKCVDKSLMQCEGQKHPFRFGSDVNKNLQKTKLCIPPCYLLFSLRK